MKIGFNARLLTKPSLRGFNRYAVNLLSELSAMGLELYLYSDKPVHPSFLRRLTPHGYKLRESGKRHYFSWEQRWLPAQCRADRLDIFHSPFSFGLPWRAPCPTVLTIHDAINVHSRKAQPALRLLSAESLKSEFLHWTARHSASHVITVSCHAKADLMRQFALPDGKITVTLEAADPVFSAPLTPFQANAVLAKYPLSKPYIFYTGGWETRKNIAFLLKAFSTIAAENVDLVLAGGTSETDRRKIENQVHALGLADKVKLLGWIPDEDLPAFYKMALCFVYPSAFEGFGLQVCEAMATGCPVVASNSTSLPEVVGDGGELFDLADPSELAFLLNRIVRDPAFRSELKIRASQRGRAFSWRKTAELTLETYQRLLKPPLAAAVHQAGLT